jgi:hypothetical protein
LTYDVLVGENGPKGRWILSSARYYIRMANQLLVEDENFGQDSKGFVMLTADLNVKLKTCHKGLYMTHIKSVLSLNSEL